jgi:hypothetical protein
MSVIVWMDDRHVMAMKGNNGGGWSSDSMALWLERRQNGDVIEWWRECQMLR